MAIATAALAIDGGAALRTRPFPSALHGAQEIGQDEIDAVSDALRRQLVYRRQTGDGESCIDGIERTYREFIGRRFALAVNGGTTALVCALVGLGVGTGDEVIVPGYTFVASASAALVVGAIPVIAEVDDTLTLDPRDLERKITPLTRCIMPVHMRGFPCQMDEIMAVARRHGLLVLEDAAQANGGEYKGRKLGSIGNAGAFSFQRGKVITSGEGGMVVTDDETTYIRTACRHDCAHRFWEPEGDYRPFAGENNRMSQVHAALGLAQFQRLPGILAATRALKRRVIEGLRGCPGVTLARLADPEGDCGLSVAFCLPEDAGHFSAALAAEGIPNDSVANHGFPMRHIYRHWDYVLNKWSSDRTGYPWAPQYYRGSVEYSPDMCPRTLDILDRAICLNLSQRFSEADADDMVAGVWKVATALYGNQA